MLWFADVPTDALRASILSLIRQQGEKWGEGSVPHGLTLVPLQPRIPNRKRVLTLESLKIGFPLVYFLRPFNFGKSGPGLSVARAKPLILIAEDSLDGREMMRTLLRLKGYDVVVAEDGVQAVEMALTNSPDLIFVDVELPRLDGISVARNIHRSGALRNVPIVVVSGHDPRRYEEAALAAGCSQSLIKPIDFQRLDAILELNVSLAN